LPPLPLPLKRLVSSRGTTPHHSVTISTWLSRAPTPCRQSAGAYREGAGTRGTCPPPPEMPMLKKIGVFFVNTLVQWLLACLQQTPTRALPLDLAGGLLPPVPVLSPSETNFWLRPRPMLLLLQFYILYRPSRVAQVKVGGTGFRFPEGTHACTTIKAIVVAT